MAAVPRYGLDVECASDDLNCRETVAMAAVLRYGFNVDYASDDLNNKRYVNLTSVFQKLLWKLPN